MKLRRNWAVEEMVAHFTQGRANILAFARKPPPPQDEKTSERPKKRRKVEVLASAPERRSTRSQSRRVIESASQASFEEPASTQEEVADSEDEGSVYRAGGPEQKLDNDHEPHDGLVACPCCHRRMKETAINAHLDRCIQGLPTSPSPPVLQPVSNGNVSTTTLSYAQRTKSPLTTAQKDRLPTINYSLYTETSLRKKLKELGIPSHGTKELMRKRHTEWMNLWNANCDSLQPKAKSFLLKELDTWERTLGRQLEKGVTSSSSGVMVKDFDRDSWAKSQKGEFDDLIRKAREQRNAASKPKEQGQDSKPPGDILMTDNHESANAASGEDSAVTMDDEHVTSSGPIPIPYITLSSTPMTKEEGGLAARDTTAVVEDDASKIPDTLPTTALGHAAIDLTSSPLQGSNDQSPEKQRSKFFA